MIIRAVIALTLLLGLTLTSPTTQNAEAFTGTACGSDCTSCHKLDIDEAGKLLRADRFKATVKSIRMSAVKGLWEVELETQKGQSTLVYIDFAKQFLVEGRFTELSKIGQPPELKKVDLSTIPLDDAIIMGDPAAKNKIIVFDDPDCPYCRKLHVEIKKLLETRKDVAFYIKQYPLPMHPKAYDKSKALVCDKSVKLLDDVFSGKEIAAPKCETDAVDNNILLAKKLGISGTPAIIFPDGRLLPGFVNADVLEQLLDKKD
jgi:thiol:disulfide interchange protein DsbC